MRLSLATSLALALALNACQSLPAGQAGPFLGLGASAPLASGSLELQLSSPRQLLGLADLHRIHLRLIREGQTLAERLVDPAGLQANQGRVSFLALAVGPLTVEARALDAQGLSLGFASGSTAISAGQATRLPLQLLVGAPAAAGALGVDLSLVENEASGGAKPLRLMRVLPVPSAPGLPARSFYGHRTVAVVKHPETATIWVSRESHLWRVAGDLGASSLIDLGVAIRCLAPLRDGRLLVGNGFGQFWTCSDDGQSSAPLPSVQVPEAESQDAPGPVLAVFSDAQDRPLVWRKKPGPVEGAHPALAFWEWAGPAWEAHGSRPGHWGSVGPMGLLAPATSVFALPPPAAWDASRQAAWVAAQWQGPEDTQATTHLVQVDPRGNASTWGEFTVPKSFVLQDWTQDLEAKTRQGKLPGHVVDLEADGRGGLWLLTANSAPLSTQNVALVWHWRPGGQAQLIWGRALPPEAVNLTQQSLPGLDPQGQPRHQLVWDGGRAFQSLVNQPCMAAGGGQVLLVDDRALRVLEELPL